ncbi:MAG TPA: NUDIX hydrolase [Clostridia bacterium]|nr:NUDIX hydrolase [Clostridia bacterium]
MLHRNCAGGVVFCGDKVLILQNDKQEWVLPKGVIRAGQGAYEVAINRVREEAGVEAEIIGPAGETSYEFYSYSRKQPVCNKITWFIMEAKSEHHRINRELGFTDGGFYHVAEAIDKITYSQDKSLVRVSYQRLKKLTSVEKLA